MVPYSIKAVNIKFSSPCFVVRPKEATEEGAVGGEKEPTTSQEEGKKCVIMIDVADHTFE